jgi:hypothetical protein
MREVAMQLNLCPCKLIKRRTGEIQKMMRKLGLVFLKR